MFLRFERTNHLWLVISGFLVWGVGCKAFDTLLHQHGNSDGESEQEVEHIEIYFLSKKTTTLNHLTLFPTPSLFAILLAGLYK